MAQSNGFVGFLKAILRGVNLTRIIILNLVFFGILGIFLLAASEKETLVIPEQATLVLEPHGALVEQYSTDPVTRAARKLAGDPPQQVLLRELLGGIYAAAGDSRIERIVLKPDDLQAGGFAALREVGAALDAFRDSGKQVLVWSAGMSQGQYYLASHADRVVLDPQGGVLLLGLGSYRSYYKDLLDKLGVTVHLFRVGEYKSAAEPFILDHASEEAKAASRYWMNGIWDGLIADIAKDRGIELTTLQQAIQNLPAQVEALHGDLGQWALDTGLVDALATEEDFLAKLQPEAAPPTEQEEQNDDRLVPFDHYVASTIGRTLPIGKHVAVVVAEGSIVSGKSSPGKVGGETAANQLRKVREDDNVAAVVLRVNSPGGAVYPSERIRRQVALIREAGKPVVVSMGDVAASGGYWISMNANAIFAQPNTITGSIGIFGMFLSVPDALGKIGVHTDGVGTTPWAGAFDIRMPLDPRAASMIQSVIDKGYRDFIGRVAKARDMSVAEVDAVARGRVWTGAQALDRGLIDQLGGLGDALDKAAELADLDENYKVRYVERPLQPFEQFLLGLGHSRSASWIRALGFEVPTWLAIDKLAPELALLKQVRPGVPAVFAYCFCSL